MIVSDNSVKYNIYYPPEGVSRLLRGPIVFNLGFIGVDNGCGTFFSLWGYGTFEI